MNAIVATAPGKLIVAGEYAVLDNAPAICTAVNRRARVAVAANDGPQYCVRAPGYQAEQRQYSSISDSAAEFPLLAAVWGRLPVEPQGKLDITLDSQAFVSVQGKKLGIGSSAAVAVALSAALLQMADVESNARDLAMLAHRDLQGGSGSGIDIACSAAGGVIEYRMQDSNSQSRAWPPGLHYAIFWSGQSSATTALLEKLAHADSKASRNELVEESGKLAVAWQAQDAAEVLLALRRYTDTLRRFDADNTLGIFDAGHGALADAASTEVVYKPCGAGGGDLGIAVSSSRSALADFAATAAEHQFEQLDLEIEATGLCVQGKPV